MVHKIWSATKGFALTALLTIVTVACLRIFLFASFSIPTPSMQPTILPGDHVLVNKLVPGPRMDWLFSSETGDTQGHRISGYKRIARGDVLVFNAPYHLSDKIARNWGVYFIKRCMGIPGDTLSIRDGSYWIANKVGAFEEQPPVDRWVDDWMEREKAGMFGTLNWTLTSFGPVYIPRRGDEIRLDSTNWLLYKSLIEYETGGKAQCSDYACSLNGKPYTHHVFKQNYYFMAGDYARDSQDSRYWGLLPEDHIVGKAAYIWRSTDPDTKKYRFDRFLKPL